MNWTIKYLEVYCEGKLVRRVSVHHVSKLQRKRCIKNIMDKVTRTQLWSGKSYHIDIIRRNLKYNENNSTKKS